MNSDLQNFIEEQEGRIIPTPEDFDNIAQKSFEAPNQKLQRGEQIPAIENENEFLRNFIIHAAPYFKISQDRARELLNEAKDRLRQIEG